MKSTIHQTDNGLVMTLRQSPIHNRAPVIILCHGLVNIREALLPAFANAFTRAGFATITFDYHGFGESLGDRGRLVPSTQIANIQSVVAWAKQQKGKGFDPERIGLWGTSLGGGHVFAVATCDEAIRCVVSQLPFADGESIITGHLCAQDKRALYTTLDKLLKKKQLTGKELWVDLPKVLGGKESKTFFEDIKILHPTIDIRTPFLTVRELLHYKPLNFANLVTCPTLVVVAEQDSVTPAAQGRSLYETLSSDTKQLIEIGETGHYQLYYGAAFQQALKAELSWFRTYL